MTVWENVDTIASPLLEFISTIADTSINFLADVLEWLLEAINIIIDIFNKIAEFFGFSTTPEGPFPGTGGGGSRPR